jgi:PhnB protein
MAVQTLTPHIVVADASAASEWYARALGAEERRRITLPNGKVMSLALRFGELPVMVADEFPEMGVLGPRSIGGTPVVLHLLTDDVEALWQQAVDAGAEVRHPLQDAFWGERHGQIADPFGHRWGLSQHLRDVSDEELQRAAAEAFGG